MAAVGSGVGRSVERQSQVDVRSESQALLVTGSPFSGNWVAASSQVHSLTARTSTATKLSKNGETQKILRDAPSITKIPQDPVLSSYVALTTFSGFLFKISKYCHKFTVTAEIESKNHDSETRKIGGNFLKQSGDSTLGWRGRIEHRTVSNQ